MDSYDYVVLGAGPAGLAFASCLHRLLPNATVRVFDMGKAVAERQHDNPADLACGAGGAGFYSDGKFSFFPAGNAVYKLCYALLKDAHADVVGALAPHVAGGAAALGELPSRETVCSYFFEAAMKRWSLKRYPTIYLDLDARTQLIQSLVAQLPAASVSMQHEVTSIETAREYELRVTDLRTGDKFAVGAKRIVLAGGRFMPLALPRLFLSSLPMVFRRYEFGVRLETSADNPVMIGLPEWRDLVDPKFRYNCGDDIEFRTFCWCRCGETVASDFAGLRTYSGRSDCVCSARSNFGFLVRLTNESTISADDFTKIAAMEPFSASLADALADEGFLRTRYGQIVGALLHKALGALVQEFPPLGATDARLFGPTIEGVGAYPDIDDNLRVRVDSDKPELYCIGDCSGTFRGIVPCMLSGYYLARAEKMRAEHEIVFVTGNAHKAREVQQMLGPVRVAQFDLDEVQGDPEHIARAKCLAAVNTLKERGQLHENTTVIIEDTSLHFDALGGLPGPYVKAFVRKIGNSGLSCLLAGFDDRSASAQCTFALWRSGFAEPRVFVGVTRGRIVEEERGDLNFGWDAIFQPDGYEQTFAELDAVVKNSISHRMRALVHLQMYLETRE